jgi:hypothetical protein
VALRFVYVLALSSGCVPSLSSNLCSLAELASRARTVRHCQVTSEEVERTLQVACKISFAVEETRALKYPQVEEILLFKL